MAAQGIACIIPFYNEGDRILDVLKVATKVAGLQEVICVDDGSTDGAVRDVQKYYPDVRIVILHKNVGKTEAVRQGVLLTRQPIILLLDADLRMLQVSEIESAIKLMRDNSKLDMLVLRRITAPWHIKLFRGDVLIPGERIMKSCDLLDVIRVLNPERFQLEFAINKYMLGSRKFVQWVASSAMNTWPTSKVGFWKGLYRIIAMQANILNYVGLVGYTRQFIFFCRKKA